MIVKDPFCSFCGRHNDFVNVLVAAPKPYIYICDECIKLSQQVVDDFLKNRDKANALKF